MQYEAIMLCLNSMDFNHVQVNLIKHHSSMMHKSELQQDYSTNLSHTNNLTAGESWKMIDRRYRILEPDMWND